MQFRREYTFISTAESVGKARLLLRCVLKSWEYDDDLIATALLIASELATNAVLHSASAVFRLIIKLDSNLLVIGVADYDSDHLPTLGFGDPLGERGRGLNVVAAIADDYGCVEEAQGKLVFAGLHVTEPPPDVISSERGRDTASVCFN